MAVQKAQAGGGGCGEHPAHHHRTPGYAFLPGRGSGNPIAALHHPPTSPKNARLRVIASPPPPAKTQNPGLRQTMRLQNNQTA
jgi:hypothetical protein